MPEYADVKLTVPDVHILRAYLSQHNYPESWQRRMIGTLDAALEEATRERLRPKVRPGDPGWSLDHVKGAMC